MVRATHIHHMNIVVNDLEQAAEFYGRILGLRAIKRPGIAQPGLWYGCEANELHISLRPDFKGGRTQLSLHGQERGKEGRHVAFTMDGSLDDIATHLEAEGVPYVRGTAGLPQIFCEDPSGNFIELNTGWYQAPLHS